MRLPETRMSEVPSVATEAAFSPTKVVGRVERWGGAAAHLTGLHRRHHEILRRL
jgi:hypothetical protein